MRPEEVLPPIRTALRREFYLAYLNSAEWRAVRNRKLSASGYRCDTCGAKRNLQVHHLTYERLGAEADTDLAVLCADCHEREHIHETESSQLGVYLKIAREALREDPWGSISDLADRAKTLCAQRKVPYGDHQIDRALRLITGTRISRGPVVKHDPINGDRDWPTGEPTPQDVHEIFKRLEEGFGADLMLALRGFPGEMTPAEEAAHEKNVRDQAALILAAEYRSERRRRRSVTERIDAIFAGEV